MFHWEVSVEHYVINGDPLDPGHEKDKVIRKVRLIEGELELNKKDLYQH